LHNESKIIPVSTRVDNWNGVSGVCMGVPAIINGRGVKELWNLELGPSELEKLKNSATLLKSYLS